jgi:hypothetical protein
MVKPSLGQALSACPPRRSLVTDAAIVGGLLLSVGLTGLLIRTVTGPLRGGGLVIAVCLRTFVAGLFGSLALACLWPLTRRLAARRLAARAGDLFARCPGCGDLLPASAPAPVSACGRCGHPAEALPVSWTVDAPDVLLGVALLGLAAALAALTGCVAVGAFLLPQLPARAAALLLALLLGAGALPGLRAASKHLASEWRRAPRLHHRRVWRADGVMREAAAAARCPDDGLAVEGVERRTEGFDAARARPLDEAGLDAFSRGLARLLATWLDRGAARVWREEVVAWRWPPEGRGAEASSAAAYRSAAGESDGSSRVSMVAWKVAFGRSSLIELLAAEGLPTPVGALDAVMRSGGTELPALSDALSRDASCREALAARVGDDASAAALAWCAMALRESASPAG